jgi:hypothetical protein
MGAAEDAVVVELKAAVATMEPHEQERIKNAADRIRFIVQANGHEGQVALAVVGAEYAAAQADDPKPTNGGG